jgi:hypothetical protein
MPGDSTAIDCYMNAELRSVYEVVMPWFKEARNEPGISWPQFIHVPEEYSKLPYKLMIVGQQPGGWQDDPEKKLGLVSLLDCYKSFVDEKSLDEPHFGAQKMNCNGD